MEGTLLNWTTLTSVTDNSEILAAAPLGFGTCRQRLDSPVHAKNQVHVNSQSEVRQR